MFLSHIITYNALKTVHLQIHKFNERKAFISYAFSLTKCFQYLQPMQIFTTLLKYLLNLCQ